MAEQSPIKPQSTELKPQSLSKSHLPSVLMLLGGAGMMVFGFTNPDQSADLINNIVKLVGFFLTGGAAVSATRVGVKKDIAQAVPSGDAVATLNDTVLKMIGGMERIQSDFVEKHKENKKSQEELKASLNALLLEHKVQREDDANERRADRERIAVLEHGHKTLEDGQQKLGEQMVEVAHELGRLSERVEIKTAEKAA